MSWRHACLKVADGVVFGRGQESEVVNGKFSAQVADAVACAVGVYVCMEGCVSPFVADVQSVGIQFGNACFQLGCRQAVYVSYASVYAYLAVRVVERQGAADGITGVVAVNGNILEGIVVEVQPCYVSFHVDVFKLVRPDVACRIDAEGNASESVVGNDVLDIQVFGADRCIGFASLLVELCINVSEVCAYM